MLKAKEYLNKTIGGSMITDRLSLEAAMDTFFDVKRALIIISGNNMELLKQNVKYRTIKELVDYDFIDLAKLSKEMRDEIEYRLVEKF